jgi:hypothetical protein
LTVADLGQDFLGQLSGHPEAGAEEQGGGEADRHEAKAEK